MSNSDPLDEAKNLGVPRTEQSYVSVPTGIYDRLGQGYLDLRQQLQALWDAVYLTHPDKERLLRAYVQRIDKLRGGASPMLMDTALELEELASRNKRPDIEVEVINEAGTVVFHGLWGSPQAQEMYEAGYSVRKAQVASDTGDNSATPSQLGE